MQGADRAKIRHVRRAMQDLQEEAREFMRAALAKSGLSPNALAAKAGIAATSITRPLNSDKFKFVPKAATLTKIADAAGIQLPTSLRGIGSEPVSVTRRIPVHGDVQAGAWSRIPDSPGEVGSIALDLPGLENTPLFALRVVGRSMDMIYREGTYVVIAPASEFGVEDGDIVAVRRWDGAFAETTLKEIGLQRDGSIMLIPRTTDPTLATPIRYERGDETAQLGLVILGPVVASYDYRPRRKRTPIDIG